MKWTPDLGRLVRCPTCHVAFRAAVDETTGAYHHKRCRKDYVLPRYPSGAWPSVRATAEWPMESDTAPVPRQPVRATVTEPVQRRSRGWTNGVLADLPEAPPRGVTGHELRRERRMAEVSTVALSAAMGISRQWLYLIERAKTVPGDRAAAYRAAMRGVSRS